MHHRPRVVILTGAGISAESGIATFRASDGLWEQHRIEDVATPEGFSRDAALVHSFYNQRRLSLGAVTPNPAHAALAKLQQLWGERVLLVTQNVDDLHERAGSPQVLHMHGELLKVRCVRTGRVYQWHEPLTTADRCSCCQPGQGLRPHIVWFGEMPLEMERIYEALAQADLFVAIGTSGNVYPAAGFVAEAKRYGALTLELNLEPSSQQSHFSLAEYGPASSVVPAWVESMLAADDWRGALQGFVKQGDL
ncbi:MAG: Sir2 family NAD+-dependent deacetylase [Aeromonadaceae bacterium]